MKPEVAESKIDSFSKERLHDGESIEENKNVAPSSIQNNYTFSFSLVTNRRVIVIVKLAILAVFTRRERERERKWILRAAGRVVFMLESRFSSRFETTPLPEYSLRLIYLYGG